MITAFIKGMRMIKHLPILAVASMLLISGCIDLPDSDPGTYSGTVKGSGNEFFGVWEDECNDSSLATFTFSEDLLVADIYFFENFDCTGSSNKYHIEEFNIIYGDQVIVDSGIEATTIERITRVGPEQRTLQLLHRDGDDLYFGEIPVDNLPTAINFDRKLTLQ